MGHPQKQKAWKPLVEKSAIQDAFRSTLTQKMDPDSWTIWSLGDALLQTLDRERVTFHAADLRSKEVSGKWATNGGGEGRWSV